MSHPIFSVRLMSSNNPSGADNQQETVRSMLDFDPWWVVGFVDGEGCFSVSIHRSGFAKSTGGWQLHPVFHVYQHEEHGDVLEQLVVTFGCGRIRRKGSNSCVSTYAVDSLADLNERVVPFFEQHPLIVKGRDFARFAEIVRGMLRKEHLRPEGFEPSCEACLRDELRRHATKPNHRRDPDGILRDCTPGAAFDRRHGRISKGTVRSSWRHGESGRNDLTTSSAASCDGVTTMPKVAKFLVG
jgi:LAGLIDADG endonuclease